jgi:outer membrane protein assembly factor BamB
MRIAPLALLLSISSAMLASAADWPRWRGPAGTGHSEEKGLPVSWDEKSVVWKTPLKGSGQSSPIVIGERIFLTAAEDNGKKRLVCALERNSGKMLWEQVAWTGVPEPTHKMNGWATSTCCSDGERVYACFGKAGLHAYTVDGKHLWSRELGEFRSKTKRGTAASPVVAGDIVIYNGDSESDPYLFGLDKLTGEIKWQTKRPAKEGYSTPILVPVKDRTELVLNGDEFVAGYDPATGKQLWSCKSFAPRGEPTPTFANGLIYVINGQPGDIYAVRPGGSGNVTKTHMVWHTPRKNGRDQPSPIVVGDYLLVANMDGVLNCYDVRTGKDLWKDRISDAKVCTSPVAVEGRVYFQNEAGEVMVVAPGPELKLLARNTVGASADEVFRSTPTPHRGQFLLRSDRVLYCVGKP